MNSSDALGIIAILIALGSWFATSRAAASANEQVRILREQWAAHQHNEQLANLPKVRLLVQHLDVGSYINLSNHGLDVVHIESVYLDTQEMPYLDFLWDLVQIPKLSTVPPESETMLIFGIGSGYVFGSTHLKAFPWTNLNVTFSHGMSQLRWRLNAQLQLDEKGQFQMRNLRVEEAPAI